MKHIREFILFIGLVHILSKAYKTINMRNWKTTVFGAIASLCAFLVSSNIPDLAPFKEIIISVGTLAGAACAYFMKDKDVTGVAKSLILLVGLSFLSHGTYAQTDSFPYAIPNLGGKIAVPINNYPTYKGYTLKANKDTTVIFRLDSTNYFTITNPYKGVNLGDSVIIKMKSPK